MVQCAARCLSRRGIDWQDNPSASVFMSSRLPLRIRRPNSSDVNGKVGSSSTGFRNRGPKNHRTRPASRRMSNPSRQQQTFTEAYCSSRREEIARAGVGSAPKISRRLSTARVRTRFSPGPRVPISRQSRRTARNRHCPADRSGRRSRERSRRDIPLRHRS